MASSTCSWSLRALARSAYCSRSTGLTPRATQSLLRREDSAIPSGETSICSHLHGISVAKCGQYFDACFQILAPVIFRGGVPDVLLRLANCWRRIDRYEFVVAADKEITGV